LADKIAFHPQPKRRLNVRAKTCTSTT